MDAVAERASGAETVARLQRKLVALLTQIEQSETYRLVAAPETSSQVTVAIIRNILLEVFSYGPHVTEATFTAIGRMPKDRPDLMRPMVLHDLSEVNHGELALQDYIRLGGDERQARTRRITPASFVMGATCRLLAERDDPFAYLGYIFLFEALTPVLTERAQAFLAAKAFPNEARHFIDLHATEDVAHARLLADLIERVVNDFPSSAEAIEYGFDCFAAVYPLPIWDAALARARVEIAAER